VGGGWVNDSQPPPPAGGAKPNRHLGGGGGPPPAVRRTASRQGVVWWRVADEHSFTQSSTRRGSPPINVTSATILPCAVAHRHPQPNDGMASKLRKLNVWAKMTFSSRCAFAHSSKRAARDRACADSILGRGVPLPQRSDLPETQRPEVSEARDMPHSVRRNGGHHYPEPAIPEAIVRTVPEVAASAADVALGKVERAATQHAAGRTLQSNIVLVILVVTLPFCPTPLPDVTTQFLHPIGTGSSGETTYRTSGASQKFLGYTGPDSPALDRGQPQSGETSISDTGI
jgi:hypothetical protein